MTRLSLLAAVAFGTTSFAQVRVELALPTVTFVAPPRLAVLQPGVQVVEDAEDEVFFVDNGYWTRHGNHWYRSPDHRGHWVLADRRVPPSIARYQPGQYRHWKQGGGPRVDRKEQRKGKPEQGRDDRANDGRDEHERGQR